MAAKLFDLTDYRRRKPVGSRSRSGREAEIFDIADARRMRAVRKSAESLKGRGFPDDLNFGPDEPDPMLDEAMEQAMMRMIFGEDVDLEEE